MSTTEKIPCKFCEGEYTERGMKLHVTRKHPASKLTGSPTPDVSYDGTSSQPTDIVTDGTVSWWDKVKAKFQRS